jgi:PncC family amidohydrolase
MNDLMPVATRVGALLKARGETVAVAESSTGGLIAASLLSVPGASAYFLGGAVVYTRRARTALLAAPDDAVRGLRSASEPYAQWLARTARTNLGATWGVSETGATGPSGNRYGDAAGHSCVAIAGPLERVRTIETGHGDRVVNMRAFALAALEMLEQALRQ